MSAGNPSLAIEFVPDLSRARQGLRDFTDEAGRGVSVPFRTGPGGPGGGSAGGPNFGRGLDDVYRQLEEAGRRFTDNLNRFGAAVEQAAARMNAAGSGGGAGGGLGGGSAGFNAVGSFNTSNVSNTTNQQVDQSLNQLFQNIDARVSNALTQYFQAVDQSVTNTVNNTTINNVSRAAGGAGGHGFGGGGLARHFGAFAVMRDAEQILRNESAYGERLYDAAGDPAKVAQAELRHRTDYDSFAFGAGRIGRFLREDVFSPFTGEATSADVQRELSDAERQEKYTGETRRGIEFSRDLSNRAEAAATPSGYGRQRVEKEAAYQKTLREINDRQEPRRKIIEDELQAKLADINDKYPTTPSTLFGLDTNVRVAFGENGDIVGVYDAKTWNTNLSKAANDEAVKRRTALGGEADQDRANAKAARDAELADADREADERRDQNRDEAARDTGLAAGGVRRDIERDYRRKRDAAAEAKVAREYAGRPDVASSFHASNVARENLTEEEEDRKREQASLSNETSVKASEMREAGQSRDAERFELWNKGQAEIIGAKGDPERQGQLDRLYRRRLRDLDLKHDDEDQQREIRFQSARRGRSFQLDEDSYGAQREAIEGRTNASLAVRGLTPRQRQQINQTGVGEEQVLAHNEIHQQTRAAQDLLAGARETFLRSQGFDADAQRLAVRQRTFDALGELPSFLTARDADGNFRATVGNTADPARQAQIRRRDALLNAEQADLTGIDAADERSRGTRLRSAQIEQEVTGLEATGQNYTAKGRHIQLETELQASLIQGPDANKLRELTLQTGINQLTAFRRDLEFANAGTGQAVGVGDIIGPGFRGTKEEKDEDLSKANENLTKAINDLTVQLQRNAAADTGGDSTGSDF